MNLRTSACAKGKNRPRYISVSIDTVVALQAVTR
jgi:hypothetical protein